jgi:hypothetical protein
MGLAAAGMKRGGEFLPKEKTGGVNMGKKFDKFAWRNLVFDRNFGTPFENTNQINV